MNKNRHLRMCLASGEGNRVTVQIDRHNCDGKIIVREYTPNIKSIDRVTNLLEDNDINILAGSDMIYLFTIL